MCRSQTDCNPFSSRTWSRYFPSGEILERNTCPLLVRFSTDICSTGKTFLRGKREWTPNAAATSSRTTIPSRRAVPNLFLLAAAIRMELLEARGDSAGVTAGADDWAGMRVEEDVTGAAFPESNSR